MQTIKVGICGDPQIGKTREVSKLLIEKGTMKITKKNGKEVHPVVKEFFGESSSKHYNPTCGVGVHPYDLNVEGTTYRINFWDTGGQKDLMGLGPQGYFLKADIIIIFAQSRATNVSFWINECMKVNCISSGNISMVVFRTNEEYTFKDFLISSIKQHVASSKL